MLPKKIYLNYINENDVDKTWSEEPISVSDFEMNNREYIDLSQAWYDISEPPLKSGRILVLFSNGKAIVWRSCSGIAQQFNEHNAIKWAYIDDLLPKGCKLWNIKIDL